MACSLPAITSLNSPAPYPLARFCYVSGMDYECVCGRWDTSGTAPGGGSSRAAGNANSLTGAGHGRAVGPKGMAGLGGQQSGAGPASSVNGASTVGRGATRTQMQEGGVTADEGHGSALQSTLEEVPEVAKAHPAARKPDSQGEDRGAYFTHHSGACMGCRPLLTCYPTCPSDPCRVLLPLGFALPRHDLRS